MRGNDYENQKNYPWYVGCCGQAVDNKEEHRYSIKDVTVLQLYCAEQYAIHDDSEMYEVLNVNRDNSLDMTDALLIQLKISDIFDFNNVYGKQR